MDNLIKLVYFDDKTDRAHTHLFMPEELATYNALFVDANGALYSVVYYNAIQRVAFALRWVNGQYDTESQGDREDV